MTAAILASCGGNAPAYPTDIVETGGKELAITFFAHSSMLLEYDGHTIYTDPVEGNADYASLPAADVIIVSHEHYDHCDPKAIEKICTPGTVIVTNAGAAALLDGLSCKPHVETMANGDVATPVPYMKLEAVAAYNYTEGHTGFHPEGRDNGFVITLGDKRLYFAGDTEDTPEMLSLRDIDIAFLPVNQPYTMTEEQASRALHAMRPAVFYPIHYGQVEHRTDLDKLARLIGDLPTEMRIRPMQ